MCTLINKTLKNIGEFMNIDICILNLSYLLYIKPIYTSVNLHVRDILKVIKLMFILFIYI